MEGTDQELSLSPLAGKSGNAYKGTYPDGREIFVKMNTSPILAGLAKEQIAPQLLWSRRMPDGQVMTGQQWLNGKILTPGEMGKKQIINILSRLHRSRHLMVQLTSLGKQLETPIDLLNSWREAVHSNLRRNQFLQEVVDDLRQSAPGFREDHATIVHGDVRHSNWIETESGLIYLVDWDSVRLTDRMFDVAHLLSHYIPESRWQEWLVYYGYRYNEKVLNKLYWYAQYSYLNQIGKYYANDDIDNVNREIYALRNFRTRFGKGL